MASVEQWTRDEWISRFTEYVDQSADRLRQTSDLNRQLTRRIAYGDLPPAVVESRLAGFFSRNAEPYASEMAGIALHFLTALVDVNADYVRELLGNSASTAMPAEPALSPIFDPADNVDWYERLTEYAAARSAESATLVRDAREAVPTDSPTEFATNAASAAVQRLADVYLSLLSRLEAINSGYGSRYLQEILALGGPAERAEAPVRAVAPLGSTATIRFVVSNTTGSMAEIRCVLTDMRRSDGVGPAFEPAATITPSHLRLASGQQDAVTLLIVLEEPMFAAGPTYSGSIRILGAGERIVELPIEIRAAAPELSAAEPT